MVTYSLTYITRRSNRIDYQLAAAGFGVFIGLLFADLLESFLYPMLFENVQQSKFVLASIAIAATFTLIFALRRREQAAKMLSDVLILLLIVPLVVNWLIPPVELGYSIALQGLEVGLSAFLYAIIHIALERRPFRGPPRLAGK
jgi:hypothetical protein